jgi:hypothetical protein
VSPWKYSSNCFDSHIDVYCLSSLLFIVSCVVNAILGGNYATIMLSNLPKFTTSHGLNKFNSMTMANTTLLGVLRTPLTLIALTGFECNSDKTCTSEFFKEHKNSASPMDEFETSCKIHVSLFQFPIWKTHECLFSQSSGPSIAY